MGLHAVLHGKSRHPQHSPRRQLRPQTTAAPAERQFIRRYPFRVRATAPRAASRAQALEGTVVSITPESVFVDIGRKMEGVLPVDVFRDAKGALTVKVGDKLLVSMTGRDPKATTRSPPSRWNGPRIGARWRRAFAEQRAIGGMVTEVVKGGLRVDVGVPRRFCPPRAAAPRIRRNWRSWSARKSSAGSSSWTRPTKTWWWTGA